jgi:lipopolysaccharide transport system permease protein
MSQHPIPSMSPQSLVAGFWRQRTLIRQLTWREVIGRYRGSMIGVAWSLLHPLLMLAVYTFVFAIVFEAKWPGVMVGDSKARFALVLFVGVVAHGILAEAITRAPGLILGNQNYVKKVVFPLETLGWSVVGSALFHAAVGLFILIAATWVIEGSVAVTALWLPLIFLPLGLFGLGAVWLLSSLGVFIRDIAQITGVFATVLMFLAPVFYPVTALPEAYRGWLYLNPITPAIEMARQALFVGVAPDAAMLGLYYLAAIAAAVLGYAWFQKTRRGFADVL